VHISIRWLARVDLAGAAAAEPAGTCEWQRNERKERGAEVVDQAHTQAGTWWLVEMEKRAGAHARTARGNSGKHRMHLGGVGAKRTRGGGTDGWIFPLPVSGGRHMLACATPGPPSSPLPPPYISFLTNSGVAHRRSTLNNDRTNGVVATTTSNYEQLTLLAVPVECLSLLQAALIVVETC